MLDINLIREKPEWVKEQIAKKFDFEAVERIDEIVKLDVTRRTLTRELETIQAEINQINRKIGGARSGQISMNEDIVSSMMTNATALKETADGIRKELNSVEDYIKEHMLWLPNLPHHSVPIGRGEDHADNKTS